MVSEVQPLKVQEHGPKGVHQGAERRQHTEPNLKASDSYAPIARSRRPTPGNWPLAGHVHALAHDISTGSGGMECVA